MLKIRLSRTGKKKQASYRVVVANKDSKRDGRVVERIGHYNPLPNPAEYKIKEERALYWLSVGAQATDAVRILLEKQGTYGRLARLNAGESLETLVAELGSEPVVAAPVVATTVAPLTPITETAELAAEQPTEVELAAEEPMAELTEEVETAEETEMVEEIEPAEEVETAEEAEMVEEIEPTEEAEAAEEVELAEEAETADEPEMTEAEEPTTEPEAAEENE